MKKQLGIRVDETIFKQLDELHVYFQKQTPLGTVTKAQVLEHIITTAYKQYISQ